MWMWIYHLRLILWRLMVGGGGKGEIDGQEEKKKVIHVHVYDKKQFSPLDTDNFSFCQAPV